MEEPLSTRTRYINVENDAKLAEYIEKFPNSKFSADFSADKKSTYSKTDINRMSTADLKELAKEQGIDDELSGADIKKALIKKFEL